MVYSADASYSFHVVTIATKISYLWSNVIFETFSLLTAVVNP